MVQLAINLIKSIKSKSSFMLKILVVSNDNDSIYTIESLFYELKGGVSGFEAEFIKSGEEALKLVFNTADIILIVLDINTSDISGYEVAKLLKTIDKAKNIPLVFLVSEFRQEEFDRRGFKLGAIDYFVKPIDRYGFLNKIGLYINLAIRNRELELKVKNNNELKLDKIKTDKNSDIKRVKNIPSLSWDIHIANNTASCSKRFLSIIGKNELKLESIDAFFDIFYQDDKERFRRHFLSYIADNRDYAFIEIVRAIKPNGETVWLLLHAKAVVQNENIDTHSETIQPEIEKAKDVSDNFKNRLRNILKTSDAGKNIMLKQERIIKKAEGKESVEVDRISDKAISRNHSFEFFAFTENITKRMENIKYLRSIGYDMFYNVPSKAAFREIVSKMMYRNQRDENSTYLIFVDLNNFNSINLNYSKSVGDYAIKTVSARIVNIVRKEDAVTRISGDKFAVAVCCIKEEKDILPIAQRILNAIATPIIYVDESYKQHEIKLLSTLGISVFSKDKDKSVDSLIDEARYAAYFARYKKAEYGFFDKVYFADGIETVKDSIEISYKPKVDASNGNVAGFDVNVNVKSSDTKVKIDKILYLMRQQKSGSIELKKYILQTLAKRLSALKNRGFDLSFCVDISSYNIQSREFIDIARTACGMGECSLEFEVSEAGLFEDTSFLCSIFRYIGSLGVKMSISDFYMDYSFLSNIKATSFDSIKFKNGEIVDIFYNKKDYADKIKEDMYSIKPFCSNIEAFCPNKKYAKDNLIDIGFDKIFYFEDEISDKDLDEWIDKNSNRIKKMRPL
jgi:diguanylate cyclase (GGDEF)-like protein